VPVATTVRVKFSPRLTLVIASGWVAITGAEVGIAPLLELLELLLLEELELLDDDDDELLLEEEELEELEEPFPLPPPPQPVSRNKTEKAVLSIFKPDEIMGEWGVSTGFGSAVGLRL